MIEKYLNFRLKQGEWDKLQQLAKDMQQSTSKVLRELLLDIHLDKRRNKVEIKETLLMLYVENSIALRTSTNNLNQIAYNLNLGLPVDSKNIIKNLKNLKKICEEIRIQNNEIKKQLENN